jgi:hypothetical protein
MMDTEEEGRRKKEESLVAHHTRHLKKIITE